MFFLLKVIVFFFLFLFMLGFFSLIVLRYKVKRFLKKNGAGFNNSSSQRRQGDVWVDNGNTSSQAGKSRLKDVGEYIDYEEVKE